MKLLFDENLSHRLVERLADIYPGSQHVRQLGMQSASDRAVLGYAELMDLQRRKKGELDGLARDDDGLGLIFGGRHLVEQAVGVGRDPRHLASVSIEVNRRALRRIASRQTSYRMLASFDEAEDAFQETFLRAWRSRDSFDGSQWTWSSLRYRSVRAANADSPPANAAAT